ncbi:hypothetical protein PHAVU_004G024600 [Phaseolus vulgaris]|uniref:Thaumatin-like protein n=1 Tax=Phaseolus vulgaris TaxID=3885 RepID=V7C1F4_PHAVU|nr:hypothetical protein PHAVU_004G024600g [Phaseolus vulgaris]ESW23173.1 hypothetical protein PHAVU_004G024600g [Phaseolus vulgaris]
MQLPKCNVALFFFLICSSIYSGNAKNHVTFYLHNKCSFPIWPAFASNNGQPEIADGGFPLAPDQTQRMIIPWTWNGRIWARTGCNFSSNGKPGCETGDCEGRQACRGLIGTPPATLVEVSLEGGKPDYYDVSLVDGYNIPVSITPRTTDPKCLIGGCLKDINSLCPPQLKVLNSKGEVVGCKSACLAFGDDRYCCRNAYGTPEKCRPSVYSKIFKDACPSYFSYAFDSPTPLVRCASSLYVVTFCPPYDHRSE